MQLLQAWKDSLSLFNPKHLKLFLLVTLKSIIETYSRWFTYFWWLIGLYGVAEIVRFTLPSPVIVGIYYIVLLSLFFSMYLIARPSVAKKDSHYFWQYSSYGAAGALLIGIAVALTKAWVAILAFVFLFDFMVLFYLDSDGSVSELVRSCRRAFKMFWYNLPFCFLSLPILLIPLIGVGLFLASIIFVIAQYALGVTLYFREAVNFTIPLVYIALLGALCFTTNFYVKKIHEQFSLYFDE